MKESYLVLVISHLQPTIFLSELELTISPLCATAKTPWAVCTTNGWQLTSSEAALVEYLVWPIPRLPEMSFVYCEIMLEGLNEKYK